MGRNRNIKSFKMGRRKGAIGNMVIQFQINIIRPFDGLENTCTDILDVLDQYFVQLTWI